MGTACPGLGLQKWARMDGREASRLLAVLCPARGSLQLCLVEASNLQPPGPDYPERWELHGALSYSGLERKALREAGGPAPQPELNPAEAPAVSGC